jgi:AcrR family transcriptional regulator
MPRTEQQNQQIRDERQEQILNAALKVFARRGMGAAKIGDIAKEAGLSHGLVYHYFKSKEEIFTTLVKRAASGSTMVVEYAKQQQGSPLEQLRWMTQMILQSIAGEGAYLFLIMIQAFTSDAVPQEVRDMLDDEFVLSSVNATIPLIVSGQSSGEIVQDDPEKLAICYYSLIQGLAISRIQRKDCPLPDAEMILRIFKSEK